MHHDVVRLPAERDFTPPLPLTHLGSSSLCRFQGFFSPARLVSLQGHPEFNADIMRELLTVRHARGVFDDDVFADSMARVDRAQDGVLVGRAFLRFLFADDLL